MIIVPINQSAQYGVSNVNYEELMNDDAFARLVSEDVKNKVSSNQKKVLLNPNNWARWKDALLALSENLEDQLFNIDSDATTDQKRYEAMGESVLVEEAAIFYKNKKNKIARFKFHVDRRIDEVVSLIEKNEPIKTYPSGNTDSLIEFYEKAISTHKSLIYEYNLEETSIDRALWDTLEGKWDFSKVSAEFL